MMLAVRGWQTVRTPADDVRHRLRPLVAYVQAIHRTRRRLFQPEAA